MNKTMTSEEPNVTSNGRYSIIETARALQVSKQTIYNYLLKGVLKCGVRRANGTRFVMGSEILRFWKSIL